MDAVLLVLPKTVLQELFTVWLDVKSVGRLDSAVCVKESRNLLEQHLQSGRIRCTDSSTYQHESFICWVVKRKVQVHDIVFGDCFVENADARISFLKVTGKSLRNISFVPMKDSPGATHVTNRVNVALRDISLHCQNLESCNVNSPTSSNSAILTLLARNQKLRRVSLEGSEELLVIVAQLLPTISDITIFSPVPETTFNQFMEICPESLMRLALPMSNFKCSQFQRLTACQNLVVLRVGEAKLDYPFPLDTPLPNLIVFRCVMEHLSGISITAMANCMPRLQTLIVLANEANRLRVDQRVLYHLLDCMPKLRQFATEQEDLLRKHPLPPLTPRMRTITHQIGAQTAQNTASTATCSLEEMYLTTPGSVVMERIFTRCPCLRYVGVSEIPLTPAPQLESSFLKQCTKERVTRLAVTYINRTDLCLTNIRGIEELLFLNCVALTDPLCKAIAQNNPSLKVLCMRNVSTHVTHHALLTFLKHCPMLHSVEFSLDTDNGGKVGMNHKFSKSLFRQMLFEKYPNVKCFESNMF